LPKANFDTRQKWSTAFPNATEFINSENLR